MAIFDHTATGEAKVRERGRVDEVLRTNGDKKDNVDLAKKKRPSQPERCCSRRWPRSGGFAIPLSCGKQAQGGN